MITIRIGIPCYNGEISEETEKSIKEIKNYKDINFDIKIVSGTFCYRGRNISSLSNPKEYNGMAKIKQILPYDYYLSLDADIEFNIDNINGLINRDKDIVGSAYLHRNGFLDKTVGGYFYKVDGIAPKDLCFDKNTTGIIECDWVGGGFILIKKHVLESMDYPYWRHELVEYEEMAELTSEDIGFALAAKKHNYKIYLDFDNKVKHIG